MIVGGLKMVLVANGSASLKQKRKVVRSITDRVKAKFNASVAEVGANDLWQRIELGFAFCGNQIAHVENQMDQVARFVEGLYLAEVTDVRTEVFNLKEMAWAPGEPKEWPA